MGEKNLTDMDQGLTARFCGDGDNYELLENSLLKIWMGKRVKFITPFLQLAQLQFPSLCTYVGINTLQNFCCLTPLIYFGNFAIGSFCTCKTSSLRYNYSRYVYG